MNTGPSRRIVVLLAALCVAAMGTVAPSGAAASPLLVVSAPATVGAGASMEMTVTYGDGVVCPPVHPDQFGFSWGDGNGERLTAPADNPCVASASHTYADEGSYQLVVRAFRNAALLQTGRARVTVTNTVPRIQVIADDLAPLRSAFAPTVVLSDGDGDRSTVTVDWGDGSSEQHAGVGPGPLSLAHTYLSPTVVTVTLTADDGEGGVAAVSFAVRVVPTCAGRLVTIDGPRLGLAPGRPIMGTNGPDVILGTVRPDVIVGGAGDDLICGGGGNDIIRGGPGDDTIHGGPGNDTIYGSDESDFLSGGPGDDTIHGGAGSDLLDGGTGVDVLDGGLGIDACGPGPGARCERVSLGVGDTGAMVARLQLQLATKKLYRGPIDGVYDTEVAAAVVAFHKAIDQARTDGWAVEDWGRLDRYTPWVPARGEADRVEVDVGRQTLTLVKGGVVRAVIPVSTGGGYTYYSQNTHSYVTAHTPRGHFHLFSHANGWQCSYMGCIYYPFYFTPHYAIHGYPSVPVYPASHGCVRVPNWEAEYLDGQLYLGMAIYVWDDPPG
ncbi:MAG TPA: L,D-transpeptidase family protein [Acidimicrobiia bacterium]|nr:L,D-transpeptidase family protein [Acidimicrobiia bacterium]